MSGTGESSCGCAAGCTPRPAARPRRITTSARASASSSCSASAIRRRSAHLELGRLAAAAGARSRATRYLTDARRDVRVARRRARARAKPRPSLRGVCTAGDAAATSASRWMATMRWCGGWWTRGDAGAARARGRRPRCSRRATRSRGCSSSQLPGRPVPRARRGRLRRRAARGRWRAPALRGSARLASARSRSSRSAATPTARGFAVVSLARPLTAGARGSGSGRSARCCARDSICVRRASATPEARAGALERQLEPLLPGFVCASAAMQRVADQIQRLQGNDLTVLITGESGTGKDLVARAIHAGSPRRGNMFLPYNCTSATRELADSQLFGHRRGSFTGARRRSARRAADGRRRHAVPRRSRRPADRRPAEAAALSRAGRGAAGRRNACRSASTSASSPRPTPISSSA